MPRLVEQGSWASPTPPVLMTQLASTPSDVLDSQRLRYQVFAEEMGAHLPSADHGIDTDSYDDFCQHLLVRETVTNEVVASTRVLVAENAAAAGGFYSEGEFELDDLRRLPGQVMEVGRTCVRSDYRTGWAINALWTGLARFMTENRFEFMMGCASIPFAPGDVSGHALLNSLYTNHPPPTQYRVQPRRPIPSISVQPAARAALPPLLKAYLRLGAWICGEACWDPDFGVADVFILLDVKSVPERYRRHFLRGPALVS